MNPERHQRSTKDIPTTSAPKLFQSSPTYAPFRYTDFITPEIQQTAFKQIGIK
jgi:hypothetical protein